MEANRRISDVIGGGVMTATTLRGFGAISGIAVALSPVLAMVTSLLVTRALSVRPISETLSEADARGADLTFGQVVSSVVGTVIVGAITMPDITRFVREWHGAIGIAFLTYAAIGSIVEAAGGLASLAFRNDDLLEVMIEVGLGWGAFVVIFAASWVQNSVNLYSATLGVTATLPQAERSVVTVFLGVLGILAAFFDILDFFLSFLFYLAIIFTPVAGVIAVDFCLRKDAYHTDRTALERSINPSALLSWVGGAIVALLGSEGVLAITGIAALDAISLASAGYFVLSHLESEVNTRWH